MGRQVIRTENLAADAADFILDQAHKALGERNEFRIDALRWEHSRSDLHPTRRNRA
jgi:hypothetical protein